MNRRLSPLAVVAVLVVGSACDDKRPAQVPAETEAPGVVIVKRTSDGVRLAPEQEPNDELDQAYSVPVPGGITGTIDGPRDVDRYRIALDADQALAIAVTGAETADLVVEITSRDGKVIASCDNGAAGASEGVPNLPLKAGEYLVVVREVVKKGGRRARQPAVPAEPAGGASYRLVIKPSPAPALTQELEPNGTPAQARALTVGADASGYIGWRRDVDVWALPATGPLDIDVDGVTGVGLELAVLRGEQTVLQRSGGEGESLAVRSFDPGAGAPAYLRVSGRKSNFQEPYVIRLAERALGYDEESEPNDAASTATPLAIERSAPSGVRRGTLSAGDVDFYWLEPAAAGPTLHITVEPAVSLDVSVAALSGATVVAEANQGGKGSPEKLQLPVSAGARLLVKVTRVAAEEPAASYTVRWSLVGQAVIPPAMYDE
jgi:hypothetical protein